MDWKLFFTAFCMLLPSLETKRSWRCSRCPPRADNFMPVFLGASAALVVVTFIEYSWEDLCQIMFPSPFCTPQREYCLW